jgi:acetyltransferase-like isoleucine patch superfamily enzyme
MAFLSEDQLRGIGFGSLGRNVSVSEKASIYNPANIWIDDYARIDDFCILSAGAGGIRIGKYVHVGCYASLIGDGEITLEDFTGLSGRVSLYSSNDDNSGRFMAHPTIPMKYRNVETGPILIEKHAMILTGAVVLPNVTVHTGAVVGALSLVKDDCDEFGIYAGCPARKVKERSRHLLQLEREFLRKDRGEG